MKPGDRVIWLRSAGRSFLTGWRVQKIGGVIVAVCSRRVRVKVQLGEEEKIVYVDPENLLCIEQASVREASLKTAAGLFRKKPGG